MAKKKDIDIDELDVVEISSDDFDMSKKVTVVNLAPWDIGFSNRMQRGDTTIAPFGKTRVTREELVEQVESGNTLIRGLDMYGSHATLYIDDEETRKYLEFDGEERKQNVISAEKIKEWFEIRDIKKFQKEIEENVITMAEKRYLLESIYKLKLDSYAKIEFCKGYCKYRFYGK